MSNLRQGILNAIHDDDFLNFISKHSYSEGEELSNCLAALHNEEKIDVVVKFRALQNNLGGNQVNFFSIRHVFEKLLPSLSSPVRPVMECVLHLVNEAGQDMTAGTLFLPYIDFCSVDSLRAEESLSLILKNSTQWADLLTPTIVAGSKINIEHYLHEAIRCSHDEGIEIRKRAIFSLGRIEYSEDLNLVSKALDCLELAVIKETDDQLLGNLIASAFSLYKQDKSQTDQVVALIERALSAGNEYSLHTAAEIFGFSFNEVPGALLDILLNYLLQVNPKNQNTLSHITYGVTKLLEQDQPSKGIELLEKLLVSKNLSLNNLNHLPHDLLKNQNNILNRLLTRWFLKGDKVLCESIFEVVSLAHDQNILLSVEPEELDVTNSEQAIFIARKVIGFLFSNPVTAASIIISLIEHNNNNEVTQQLSELLFDPLLINYPGKVNEYLKEQLNKNNGNVKLAIESAINKLDNYFNILDTVRNIPELYPSQLQRDAHYRLLSRQFSDSMKQGEEKSVLFSLFTRSVILYGNKSINYTRDPSGKTHRMEVPLQNHGTTIELPRLGNIDPYGLDYMLRVFRVKQIVA